MKTTMTEDHLFDEIIRHRKDRWGENLCRRLSSWISERDEHGSKERGEMIVNVSEIVCAFAYFSDCWEWAAAHFVNLENARKTLKDKATTWLELDEEELSDYITNYYSEMEGDVWLVESYALHEPFLVGEFQCKYIK